MKKSMLLVGAFLAVAAMAQAKEVVPAPVVVEEAPVQIVEKEVIVYRDKEEGFRPNGSLDLSYTAYGKTEDQDKLWQNGANNYSKVEMNGKINMTENQKLEYRYRGYNSLTEDSKVATKHDTDTRLRYYYNAGVLGDTKVGVTPFLEYKNDASSQQVRAELRFQFADYMFNNDFVKTTNLEIGPSYVYNWNDGNDSNYVNKVGLYFNLQNQFPMGFSTEIKFDDGLYYNMYGQDGRDNDFIGNLGAYIYHNADLYTNGKYTLAWYFEGGYDTYDWSSRKAYEIKDSQNLDKRQYSLYAQPNLVLSYQATEFVTLYGDLGAEYRNWDYTGEASAQDWRWQPFVKVGFNVAF